MEHIRQAIERAKDSHPAQPHVRLETPDAPPATAKAGPNLAMAAPFVVLNNAHLERQRVIGHDITDERSRSYDVLRTQVLQSMEHGTGSMMAVTSATPGCGKTLTAINLALAIARHPEKSVLLVDFDLQRPQVNRHLGLKPGRGALGLLEGRAQLSETLVNIRAKDAQMTVLPCEASTLRASQLFGSRIMDKALEDIRREFRGWTVIIDLPPILVGDETIALLPKLDCALFVAAAGTSTVKDIKKCVQFFDATPIIRVVLNKASEASQSYYSGYSEF